MSDRKYRQSGYQDSERGERGERRGPQPPPPRKEGPRGRGLGAPTTAVFRCAGCGRRIPTTGEVEPDAACPGCGVDQHACVNCTHFDSGARFECRQPIVERVARKRDRNACPLFTPKVAVEFAAEAERSTPDDARAAFDDLFKF